MSEQANDNTKDRDNQDAAIKPESETLHKTDPQDNMKGPISSLVQGIKDAGENNDKESKEEADAKQEEHK